MLEFYHVCINPKTGVGRLEIEQALDLCIDWFRYSQGVYIVYTTSPSTKLFARLQPLIDEQGMLMVYKFDRHHYMGYMSMAFWNWFLPKINGTAPE